MTKLYDESGRKVRQNHGRTRDPAFGCWRHMISRCLNPRDMNFSDYGGRGITVCDDWLDAASFCDWAHGNGYQRGLTIERVDNDGGYSPANCRWATMAEQCRNRRSNHWVNLNGMRMTISDAAREIGIRREIIFVRLSKGWSIERALSQPVREPASA